METPRIQASWITATSERLLAHLARLQERREVGPPPQLRYPQGQSAEPGVERAVTVAVAVDQPVRRALVPAGADQASHIVLHQDLQHRLGDGAQEVAVTGLLQQLGQWQSVLGRRVLRRLAVKPRNSTLAAESDDRRAGVPAAHLRPTRGGRCGPPPPVAKFHHQRGR
jgi:tryptophanyl-tRNA synthetase